MSNPSDEKQDTRQEDELELEPETVKDLDVDERGAEQIVGGATPYTSHST